MKRTAHPTDRRVAMVEITGGAATVEQGFAAFESAIGDLFDELDDAEAEARQRAIGVLWKRIDDPAPSVSKKHRSA